MNFRKLFTAFALVCAGVSPAQTVSAPLTLDPAVRYGVLVNGLTYYIRQNNYPEDQVEFYIAQKVGSMQEEEEQRGLAHFLEHMCFNGTEHFPGNSLVKYLERIGVKFGENLNAYTSIDETVYNIKKFRANPQARSNDYANRRQGGYIDAGPSNRKTQHPAHGAAVQGIERPQKRRTRDHSRLLRRDRHGRR